METHIFSRKKYIVAIATVLIFVVAFHYGAAYFQIPAYTAQQVRTVTLQDADVDYHEYLNEFDDANLEIANHAAIFSASMTFDASFFDEIDLVSDESGGETYVTRFLVTYDYYDEVVWLSAVTDTPDGEIVLDAICGKVFFDENGKADAVFDLEGESVTLSELMKISAIEQVGLFSKIVQAAKAVATVAAQVVQTAVVAVVQTVASVAAAVVKSIAEQITDLVNGAVEKIVSGALSVYKAAEAFSAAKLALEHTAFAQYRPGLPRLSTTVEEIVTYFKNLPQATAEMKKALSDDSLPILYKIIAVVTKSGLLELTAGVVSNPLFNPGLIIAAINYAHNKELNEADFLDYRTGLIENQWDCEPWKAGLNNLKWSGCGYIAAYNYMKAAWKYMRLADVIFEFDVSSTENAFSTFGINPYEYPVFFKAHGISYVRYDSVEALQAAADAKGDCRILLAYVWVLNDMDSLSAIFDAIQIGTPLNAHYVMIEKNGGTHTVHNYLQIHNSMEDFLQSDEEVYSIIITGFILP
jgi:hypothetical protein